MADQKLSELTSVSGAAASDTLYLVKDGASSKITFANLLATVPTPVAFTDKVTIGDVDTMTSLGSVSITTNVTYLNNLSSGGTLSIGTGTEGQIKIIIMTSNTGGYTVDLDDSDVQHDLIRFTEAGHTATLLCANGKWFMIGGTATVTN